MRNLKIIVLSFMILSITGCSNSNVNFVKNGVFNDYQSTTVGQAFDNWKMCDSVTWEEFESDNGSQHVEFNCFAGNSLQSYLTSKAFFFVDGNTQYSDDKKEGKIIRQGINFTTQFQINLDDSFEINYMGASSEGYGEIDLSGLGTANDFLDIIMPNQKFSAETMWFITFRLSL